MKTQQTKARRFIIPYISLALGTIALLVWGGWLFFSQQPKTFMEAVMAGGAAIFLLEYILPVAAALLGLLNLPLSIVSIVRTRSSGQPKQKILLASIGLLFGMIPIVVAMVAGIIFSGGVVAPK